MIFYVVVLYELPSWDARDFIDGFRERSDQSSRIPGCLHTDLLEQFPPSRFLSRFLSISFFTSPEAMRMAEEMPEMQNFLRWARRKTTLYVHLGTFSFPPRPDSDEEEPHRACVQV